MSSTTEQVIFRCDGVERYRTTAKGETIDWLASYEACKVKIEELKQQNAELQRKYQQLIEQNSLLRERRT
jgi:hypothetical protein